MAIAVIGGIIVSTVLSLIVVPAFFLIMDDVSRLLSRIFGGLFGKKEEEGEMLSSEELSRHAQEASQTLASLEERVASIEKQNNASDERAKGEPGSNVLRLTPWAAE
jgi:predicted RND superfamily exporter protein